MGWIRPRLTYANVVATFALFLVLGGGTALASYVISSNGQVGPGTISGHAPPNGDHANIIPGSVTGSDLANGSVTASKLGAVAKFQRKSSTTTSHYVKALSLGGLVVHYKCSFDGLDYLPSLAATSTVSHAAITLEFTTGGSGFGSSFYASDPDFNSGDTFDLDQNRDFGAGDVVYSTPSGSVVSLSYGFEQSSASCLAHGLAIAR